MATWVIFKVACTYSKDVQIGKGQLIVGPRQTYSRRRCRFRKPSTVLAINEPIQDREQPPKVLDSATFRSVNDATTLFAKSVSVSALLNAHRHRCRGYHPSSTSLLDTSATNDAHPFPSNKRTLSAFHRRQSLPTLALASTADTAPSLVDAVEDSTRIGHGCRSSRAAC
jgi:hypothetical protein